MDTLKQVSQRHEVGKKLFPWRARFVSCRLCAISFCVILLSLSRIAAGADLSVIQAVRERDHALLRSLLQKRADINALQADGTSALAWAAHWDDLEAADLLIQAGANVNTANIYGVTALSLACTNGSAAMVEKLLKAGANPNAAQRSGETPLMTCARTGNLSAVQLLVSHRADVSAQESRQKQTALMWAVAQKHSQVVRALLDSGADVHARSTGGFTPLLFAARVGDLDSIRLLLQAGADVNEKTPEGLSALLVASSSGRFEALSIFLLDQGADPNVTDGNGITPLHYAAPKGISAIGSAAVLMPNQPQLVQALLKHGAKVNAQITKDFVPNTRPDFVARTTLVGATPLFLAAASADAEIMHILADAGADPRLSNHNGMTPLMATAAYGSAVEGGKAPEAAKLLAELGGNVNAADKDGQTALHYAASAGADPIVQILAEKGADLNAQDKAGETPLRIAQGGDPEDKRSRAHAHPSTANLLLHLAAIPAAARQPSTATPKSSE